MSLYGWHNCQEPHKSQIYQLRDILARHLGDNLVGVYLHGSLVLNSFNPDTSDIDVIVLLNNSIDIDLRFELIKEFLELSNRPSPIEISLITRDAIWPWKHPTPFELHSSEYWRAKYEENVRANNKHFWAETPVDSDLACHITLINRRGICLQGAPIHEAFPPVPEQDFRSSILNDANYSSGEIRTNPIYGILSLCRVLSYLVTGDILSKGQAGEWVLPRIPEHLRKMVMDAIDLYVGVGAGNAHFDEIELEQYKNWMVAAIDEYR